MSDGGRGVVLPPDPQPTCGSAAAAGGRVAAAENRVWASEGVIGQTGGGAEEAEATSSRSRRLH